MRELLLWALHPEAMQKMADDRLFLKKEFPSLAAYA
jgi:hypothetical protein